MIKIAIDAMGGDNAPKITVDGAMQAIQEFNDIEIMLFGDENQIKPLLSDDTRITIVHCDDYYRMDEKDLAQAVRRRKETSMIKAMKACYDNKCEAIVTAGPTGAVVSGGTLIVKRIPGFYRPALGPVIPQVDGSYMLLLDCGANVECKPEWLLQFAHIASIYSEKVLGKINPRVGLLNNGEEEGKGNNLSIQAYELLSGQSGLNFIGNIEGRDLFNSRCDVLVCDGFTGNILLKTLEGMVFFLAAGVKEELGAIPPTFARLDYTQIGGAPLLGVNGISVVCHGSSRRGTVCNGLKIAADSINNKIIDKQLQELSRLKIEN